MSIGIAIKFINFTICCLMDVSIVNNEQPSLNTAVVMLCFYSGVCWNALMPLYIRIMIEGVRAGLCAHVPRAALTRGSHCRCCSLFASQQALL